MAYICSYKCADIIFDIFDSDRIRKDDCVNLFYITPIRISKVQQYLKDNSLNKITTQDQIDDLIKKDYIGMY
jgi:hypothetical protein